MTDWSMMPFGRPLSELSDHLDVEYRKGLFAAAQTEKRFSKIELMAFCQCWEFDESTGVLAVRLKNGVPFDWFTEQVYVGITITHLICNIEQGRPKPK